MVIIFLKALKQSWIDLINNWKVLPAIPILGVIATAIAAIASPLGVLGGLIIGITFIALLSLYFNWLRNSKHRNGLEWRELIIFNQEMFQRTLTIAFILYIATMIIQTISQHSPELAQGLGLLIAILFNPLPEIIYNYRADGPECFNYSVQFIKHHWPIWFVPIILLNLPILLINPSDILIILSDTSPLLPIRVIQDAISLIHLTENAYLNLAITLVIMHWFFLLRGRIFEQLD